MNTLKFLLLIPVFLFAAHASANPFDQFVGNYSVTSSLESVCTYSNDCSGDGWNLDRLIEVWIYRDEDPKSPDFGKLYLGTKAWNATNFGDPLEDGLIFMGLVQQIVGAPDGSSATRILSSRPGGPSTSIRSWQISQLPSGSLRFTYEQSTSGISPGHDGHLKYVYAVEKK